MEIASCALPTIADILALLPTTDANYAWQPACNGTEQPYKTRKGFIVQYMWNSVTGVHQYYCVTEDLWVDNTEEAMFHYGIWF